MKDIIQEMADDIYKNSNYSEAMSLEIAKFNVTNNYRKCGGDTVILTKDEFISMIKTNKEAEEYGLQCWNDGRTRGRQEAVKECIEWFFSNTTFTPQKVKKFAEQFGINVTVGD